MTRRNQPPKVDPKKTSLDIVDTSGPAVKAELNSALTANYMLITLKISRWSASKRDADLGNEVASSKGAVPDAVAATKKLMVGADEELKAVNTALNSIRTHLYESSLPWSGDTGDKKGPRIVPTRKSMALIKELTTMTDEFKRSMRTFKKVYNARVDAAMTNMGKLADRSLYPADSEINDLFSVAIDLIPVPSVDGFGGMNIPAELAQALGKRMEKNQSKIIDNATQALQERVLETVTNLSDQLHKSADGEPTRLFESLSTNIKPLVDLIDAAALSKDKRLTGLKAQLAELSKVDIKKVKKASPAIKRSIAKKADKVVKQLVSKKPPVDVDSMAEEVLF